MVTFKTSQLREIVQKETPEAAEAVEHIDFLEFGDLEGSVKSDVKFLKEHPLVLKDTKITGWIHTVETGKVRDLHIYSFDLSVSRCFLHSTRSTRLPRIIV